MSISNTISAGFSHSAYVSQSGLLQVWGDNKNSQLTTIIKEPVVDTPTTIPLKYKGVEYTAKSVYCGQTFTFVIGQTKKSTVFTHQKQELEIIEPLKQILQKKKTLAYFFGCLGGKKQKKPQKGNYLSKDPVQMYLQDDSDEDEHLKTEETEHLMVPRNQFVECVESANFTQKKNSIQLLADRLIDFGQAQGENIPLSSIEDYVIGFKQNQSKVFAFGQGYKKIFSFSKKPNNDDSLDEKDEDESMDEYDKRQKQLQMKYQQDILIVARPTVIKFPKFTRPISSLACGSAHILAITEAWELFAWGCGNYGALGFGSREDIWEPRHLEIFMEDGEPFQISGVSCGKQHSLCLTRKKNVFAWGTGQGGRLGLGSEDDQLVPAEVHGILKGKPQYISAGESHSACITDRLQLYTWGLGTFGRLGHGFDNNEYKPRVVQDLDNFEVTYVSCGAFHTLVVAGSNIYSFGQGKYGKLGINRKDRDGVFMNPERISFYKMNSEVHNDWSVEKNEALAVAAGYNHSLGLTRTGKLYSWGYNRKGMLGRKTLIEYLPFEIFGLVVRSPNLDEIIQRGESKQEDTISQEISQVACGSLNTVALTNGGEVYVVGSNAYGQLGKNPDEAIQQKKRLNKFDEGQNNGPQDSINLIRFLNDSSIRIAFIACGGEHIFAISRSNELYGWGRNEEGQLGLGIISDYAHEPQIIKELQHKNIKFVACGENYTAAVSIFGEVYVTGSLEGGKLGLGQAYKQGYLLNFKMIPGLNSIKYIACGPNHMMAISEYNPDEGKDGITYAWGRNNRGQLGIGNKDDFNEPARILSAKERFYKVACGQNFSLGLSVTNKVYFWGNYKYFCEKGSKDLEEPIMFKQLDTKKIKDIAVSNYYCVALNDKGEIWQWGKYLKEKSHQAQDKIKGQGSTKSVIKFPNVGKFDVLMETISTGPNHSAAMSVKKSLYTWGYFSGGRLGIKKDELKKAKLEPILVQYIMSLLQQNRQNHKEGRREESDDDDKMIEKVKDNDDNRPENGEEQKQKDKIEGKNEEEEKKAGDKKGDKDQKKDNKEETKGGTKGDKKDQEEQKGDGKNKSANEEQNEEEDNLGDIEDVENIVKEEVQPKEKPNIVSLSGSLTLLEATIKLQKILKKERSDGVDEDSIIRYDSEVLKDIDQVLKKFKDYQNIETQRKDMLVQIQSSFLQRVSDTPFNVQIQPELRFKGLDPALVKNKHNLKHMMTALHVHPCYMINLYKSKILQLQEYSQILKEIYSYQNDRVNYLLMAILQKLTDEELSQHQTLDEVNFLSKESVVGKLFRYIFKSQETNLDTLCSLGCHILNKLLSKFSATTSTNQDNTFDVTDVLSKGNNKFEMMGMQMDKGSKNLLLQKRANDLFDFVEEIVQDIMVNDVFSLQTYFKPKSYLSEDVNRRKRELVDAGNQALQDTIKLESLRFSTEIAYLAEVVQDKIKVTKFTSQPLDDVVITKILTLVFGQLEKIWKEYEIYLFPYIKSVKGLTIVEDQIKKIHKNNLDNVFHVVNCFFRGEQVFPDSVTEGWNKDMTLKLNHLQQSFKGQILQRITDKNNLKSISFKNFENLILHSLDNEGHSISIRKKSIHKLYTVFMDKPEILTVKVPYNEDPLYEELLALSQDCLKVLAKSVKDDRMNFKLKSRLLIEEKNPVVTRCGECNCILIQSFASTKAQQILDRYNPSDSQSLEVQYCTILKHVGDVGKSDVTNALEMIERQYQNAKRDYLFDLANKMLKFLQQLDLEVSNTMSRLQDDNQLGQDNDENKVKESIYTDIQREAEFKINERRQRRYNMGIIQNRIHNVLGKKIQAKVKQIETKELLLYKVVLYNFQYGLANHELKHLADAYTLKHMRKIIDYTTSSKMSKNLFKNLRNEQKQGLRSIVKKSAKQLLKNQTITGIVLTQLKPLIDKCEFVFFESEDTSITVKMIFREKKFALCGPPKVISEAVLLNFTITQKELLEMRKQGKSMEKQRLVLANAIEFDHSKLMKIFNEMDRSKSAYMLNSGATPLILQKQTNGGGDDNRA